MKLVIDQISKTFEDLSVLDNISLTLNDGELLCLLGTSGVGKTTLFNIISGTLLPDQGMIYLDDKDITGTTGHISYMLQKDMLLPHKTILDNVCLPLIIKHGKLRSRSRVDTYISKREARNQASELFETFGLEGTQKKYPTQLSGGMKQRAALLRTYLYGGKVALLDEPFSALDAITKQNIHDWYLSIMQELKLPTLFITHDIEEAILLSDRILILSGTPGIITKEIPISISKPRNHLTTLSDEFIQYKIEILKALGQSF